jgi:hypothetical protein
MDGQDFKSNTRKAAQAVRAGNALSTEFNDIIYRSFLLLCI